MTTKTEKARPQSADDKTGTGLIVKKETREIEFQFTDKELQEKGSKLATAIHDKFKTLLDAKQSEIDLLSEQITDGFEKKTVTVEVKRNFESGLREYWYKGEKRGEEALTALDHQHELDLAEKNNIEANAETNDTQEKA